MAVNASENAFHAMKIRQTLESKNNTDGAECTRSDSLSAREAAIETELKATVLDEDFLTQVKSVREQQPKLEANLDRMVDPDGRITAKAYVESLVKQYQKLDNTITEYYSQAHQDNSSQPTEIDGLNYISLKYTKLGLDLNSPYYRADMSEDERNMAFQQERALLLGGRVTMKDPYALASTGGLLNVKDADTIANQAVRDKLDELIAQLQQNDPNRFEK